MDSNSTDDKRSLEADGVAAPLEPTRELKIVIAKLADFVRNCGIADEGQGLNEFSQTHNNALAIVIGEMLDQQDNVPLVEALQAYAAAVSKNLQEERDQTERKYQMLLQQRKSPR